MNTALQVRHVDFHNSRIMTIRKDDTAFVAMRPIVEAMGIAWPPQQEKLRKNREKFRCNDIVTPTNGGHQKMLCIPLTRLNGFLFTINPEKIPDPEVKKRVELYQDECFAVLHDYWNKGLAVNHRKAESAPVISPRRTIEIDEADFWKLKAEIAELKLEKVSRDYQPRRRPFTQEEEAEVIRLKGLDMSMKEIGLKLGRSPESIESLVRRLRKQGRV